MGSSEASPYKPLERNLYWVGISLATSHFFQSVWLQAEKLSQVLYWQHKRFIHYLIQWNLTVRLSVAWQPCLRSLLTNCSAIFLSEFRKNTQSDTQFAKTSQRVNSSISFLVCISGLSISHFSRPIIHSLIYRLYEWFVNILTSDWSQSSLFPSCAIHVSLLAKPLASLFPL